MVITPDAIRCPLLTCNTVLIRRILAIQNHEMKNLFSLGVLSIVARVAAGQTCPELPETGVTMGEPVPMRPEDIPGGCSEFEILVGKLFLIPWVWVNTKVVVARGTSEPNYEAGGGKFGIIVGDPVVSNVTELLPGARGYPVQVRDIPCPSGMFPLISCSTRRALPSSRERSAVPAM